MAEPSEISDAEEHHALIRSFIAGSDDTVNLATRVAALLVLPYGAWSIASPPVVAGAV